MIDEFYYGEIDELHKCDMGNYCIPLDVVKFAKFLSKNVVLVKDTNCLPDFRLLNDQQCA